VGGKQCACAHCVRIRKAQPYRGEHATMASQGREIFVATAAKIFLTEPVPPTK
jgi:hypothetical protein